MKITILDRRIDADDPLYSLETKYNVKISRSQSSDAVYITRKTNGFRLRIGHPISRNQNHLQNFAINEEIRGRVTKDIVEVAIKKYLHRF